MALTVISFATYLSAPEALWREEDWAAHKFVQAIKRKPFNGFGYIPVNGFNERLDSNNALDAVRWFALMATNTLTQAGFPKSAVLVPIPNSDCAISNSQIPRTFFQAQELSKRLPDVSVLDCLRWKRPKPSSSKSGGSREPQFLYDNLEITSDLPAQTSVILIDDVTTSGGHLRATRAKLLKQEASCNLAICAARTVKDQSSSVFGVDFRAVKDWWPTPKLVF